MRRILRSIALLVGLAYPAFAGSQASAPSPADVTVTVTALNHRAGPAPRLSKGDVVVRQNGNVRPVLAWEPLGSSSAGIDLAVLVDDSLQSSVALRWKEVGGFIRLLPKNSRVAVAYGTYSGATIAQSFTSDRELAIKSLRIPRGQISEGSSIYLSLVDLIHRWPADGRRHMVLLISDGVDLFYGVVESEPGVNPNLQQAINESQKNGVVVDAIFASGASDFSNNLFLTNNGQSSLARLALETGGTSYTPTLQTPPSFSPFLKDVAENIGRMYLLTFRAALPPKPAYVRIQLRAEPQGVELRGPSRVYLPAGP